MPTSQELMLAILSMDSYNRGYGQGIEGLGGIGSQVGNATFSSQSAIGSSSSEVAAGFYAASYTLNGQKIIAYRGTDQVFSPPWSLGNGSDFWNGYGPGVGLPFSNQARMAAEFYQTVTGTQTSDPSTGNAILTGHSLGGGLAGYIAAIYRQDAYLFNSMAFESAAVDMRALAALANSLGFNLLADFYNGLPPANTLIDSNIHAFATTGELLTVNRAGQSTSVENLSSQATAFLSLVELHSMALHVILRFAADGTSLAIGNANQVGTDWHEIALSLWRAGLNEKIGAAAGFQPTGTGGHYSEAYKMLNALAYSAIDEGVRVFGDTGIRAMFNDANDLGFVVKQADASTTIIAAKGALSEILMQFAGQLAFGKVLQSAHPEALGGVLSSTATALTVDFSDTLWSLGLAAGSPPAKPIGVKTLTDTAFGVAGPIESDTRTGMKWLWSGSTGWKDNTSDVVDRITLAATHAATTIIIPDRTYTTSNVTLYAAGGGADTVTGSSGNDLIFGGGANDNVVSTQRLAA